MSDIREFQRLSDEFRKAFSHAFELYGFDASHTGTEQVCRVDGRRLNTSMYEDALFEIWRNGYEQGKLMERGR